MTGLCLSPFLPDDTREKQNLGAGTVPDTQGAGILWRFREGGTPKRARSEAVLRREEPKTGQEKSSRGPELAAWSWAAGGPATARVGQSLHSRALSLSRMLVP